jgi:pimeloyl-[acyl-carrier protein] methyl ester esterase
MDNQQKTTLVLLPGLDGTGKLFRPFVEALPTDVCTLVIAYPPNKRLSVNELAEFVASRLPPGRVVLLAESFSGLVALALLASGVKRIEAVVFCASFAEPPRPKLLWLANLIPCVGSLVRMTPAWLLRRFCLGKTATANQLSLLRSSLSDISSEVLSGRLWIVANERFAFRRRFDTPYFYFRANRNRLYPSSN